MGEHVNDADIKQAVETLRAGGLILYPTDTIWGIGCDATNPAAIERVYQLKGRSAEKSLIILLGNDNQLQSYVQEVPDVAYSLVEYAEKPLTIVYESAKNLPENVLADDGSIAIRVVKHAFCERLLERFRKPIVSTSANLSGEPAPRNFESIDPALKERVDYVVQFGQADRSARPPSTIMKLGADGKFSFLRR